jgi:hypothetical protein
MPHFRVRLPANDAAAKREKIDRVEDCFGGYFGIIWEIDFRPDDISYPPVQPV